MSEFEKEMMKHQLLFGNNQQQPNNNGFYAFLIIIALMVYFKHEQHQQHYNERLPFYNYQSYNNNRKRDIEYIPYKENFNNNLNPY